MYNQCLYRQQLKLVDLQDYNIEDYSEYFPPEEAMLAIARYLSWAARCAATQNERLRRDRHHMVLKTLDSFGWIDVRENVFHKSQTDTHRRLMERLSCYSVHTAYAIIENLIQVVMSDDYTTDDRRLYIQFHWRGVPSEHRQGDS